MTTIEMNAINVIDLAQKQVETLSKRLLILADMGSTLSTNRETGIVGTVVDNDLLQKYLNESLAGRVAYEVPSKINTSLNMVSFSNTYDPTGPALNIPYAVQALTHTLNEQFPEIEFQIDLEPTEEEKAQHAAAAQHNQWPLQPQPAFGYRRRGTCSNNTATTSIPITFSHNTASNETAIKETRTIKITVNYPSGEWAVDVRNAAMCLTNLHNLLYMANHVRHPDSSVSLCLNDLMLLNGDFVTVE